MRTLKRRRWRAIKPRTHRVAARRDDVCCCGANVSRKMPRIILKFAPVVCSRDCKTSPPPSLLYNPFSFPFRCARNVSFYIGAQCTNVASQMVPCNACRMITGVVEDSEDPVGVVSLVSELLYFGFKFWRFYFRAPALHK